MLAFHLEAVRMDGGRFIELVVYNGTPEGPKAALGSLSFTPAEWEAFRPALIAAMRWGGYNRLPISLKDQTRVKENGSLQVRH